MAIAAEAGSPPDVVIFVSLLVACSLSRGHQFSVSTSCQSHDTELMNAAGIYACD